MLSAGPLIAQSATVGALYRGGNGDGFDSRIVSLTLTGQSITVLYGGGNGDGFDRISISRTLTGTDLAILYGGGNGDGFDNITIARTLSGAELTVLYGGGAGDGHDRTSVTRTLTGTDVAILYGGGNGDGFDNVIIAQTISGATLTALYGGGNGDGFDRTTVTRTLTNTDLTVLYGGGNGDGFAELRLDGGLVVLPLTLIVFEAHPYDKYVLLKWITEDELDTDFFTIEKTRDGTEFVEVTTLDAAGFSEPGERLHYDARDESPYEGVSYYRLVTTDFDGTLNLSQLVQVQYATADGWDFTAYPNPNGGEVLSLEAQGAERGETLTLTVHDATGRKVLTHRYDHQPGTAERIDLQHRLPAGSYLLRVQRPNGEYQAKMMIVGGIRP